MIFNNKTKWMLSVCVFICLLLTGCVADQRAALQKHRQDAPRVVRDLMWNWDNPELDLQMSGEALQHWSFIGGRWHQDEQGIMTPPPPEPEEGR